MEHSAQQNGDPASPRCPETEACERLIAETMVRLPEDAVTRVRCRVLSAVRSTGAARERWLLPVRRPATLRVAWGLCVGVIALAAGTLAYLHCFDDAAGTIVPDRSGVPARAHRASAEASGLIAASAVSDVPVRDAPVETRPAAREPSPEEAARATRRALIADLESRLQDGSVPFQDAAGMLERLSVALYEEGRTVRARAVFADHLSVVESVQGAEQAARSCRLRGEKIFFRSADRSEGMAYFDMVLTRYPDTEHAQHARFMLGEFIAGPGAVDEAIHAYERVVPGGGPWALRAEQRIAQLLGNAGRENDAIARLAGLAESQECAEVKSYAAYHIGLQHYRQGTGGYPKALRAFESVLALYPGTRCARDAKTMSRRIHEKMTSEILGKGRAI